ncbi:MAG: proline--tRNA ligase [Candidatus Jacksonbacteria bacterium]|nr:proline--tRNA ligase [Candidatus Jacksonbacteria bacterium]
MNTKKSEENNNKKGITTREEDYSQWYLDVIREAELAENAPVRGCMIIKPHGYALWENIRNELDIKFKETGVANAYFPLLIPQSFLEKEADHVEGFAPELAVVTHAGGKKLDEPCVIRPTSETIIYDAFSRWVQSYRDLPLLLNQWANVVRWELRTRPFLRTTEFLWQEGHTAHAAEKEAEDRCRTMLNVYQYVAEEKCAVPVIPGEKSASERFAGAQQTLTIEAMMQDGKALQSGTSHVLGEGFSKGFDVTYLDKEGKEQYAWMTSWGLSTRIIGGIIMVHSDDKGLVIPPRISPIQAIIVPIWKTDEEKVSVFAKARELQEKGKEAGLLVQVDTSDEARPGPKFFEWEKKGIPLRIELGPKDMAAGTVVAVRRDTGEKQNVQEAEFSSFVSETLETMHKDMFEKAQNFQKEHTYSVDTWDEFKDTIENKPGFILAHWDGTEETEAAIKEETKATIRCIPFDQQEEDGVCVKSGKPSKKRVVFARAY